MGKLPNIKLSTEEYNQLRTTYYFDYGSESQIIRDGKYIIKLFKEDFGHCQASEKVIETIRTNKQQKLILLHSMKTFANTLKPLATYSYQDKLVGYRGVYLECPTLQDTYLTKREKVHYLRQIKAKLELFHNQGIIYGDIKDDNIFIDTAHNNIIFGDIDNMQVFDYPIDTFNFHAKEFAFKYGTIDQKLDSYMFNLLTIQQFIDRDLMYDDIIHSLEACFIPPEINCQNNQKLIREIVYVNKNYSGKYLIDNL